MEKKVPTRLYEGMYIISSTLSEDARKKALDRITGGLESHQAKINKIFELGRKKLAYEINGRRDGYYFLVYFEAPSTINSQVYREFHLNEDLMRFMHSTVEDVPEELTFQTLQEA